MRLIVFLAKDVVALNVSINKNSSSQSYNLFDLFFNKSIKQYVSKYSIMFVKEL